MRWVLEKNTCVCPNIDCYGAIIGPRQFVMEWTITGIVRQCPVTVLVISLLSCFTLHYP